LEGPFIVGFPHFLADFLLLRVWKGVFYPPTFPASPQIIGWKTSFRTFAIASMGESDLKELASIEAAAPGKTILPCNLS